MRVFKVIKYYFLMELFYTYLVYFIAMFYVRNDRKYLLVACLNVPFISHSPK